MKKVLLALFFCCFLAPAFAQTNYQFLEDEAEENVNISFSLKSAAAGSFSAVFDYGDKDNFYALECTPGSISLRSVIEGKPHRLATAKIAWKKPTSSVVIKRRSWLMQVIVDKKVVLTAYDISLNSGQIGHTATGSWGWSEPRVQPVEEELYFNDDFTREPGKTGEWKVATGKWQLTSSSDNINEGNQAMSANPFSYQAAAASTPALVHAGRAFWDNYTAEVSVRPAAQGTIGLAFYVQDPQNYLAFLWSSKEGAEARRLVKIENGEAKVLASAPGAFLPRQWYRLGIRTSPDTVETSLDGTPVFRTRDDSFGQGSIGLYSLGTAANFDDVRVRSYPYFRQDFNGPTGGAWQPAGGFWRAADGVLNSAANPEEGAATRMLLAGSQAWDNYEMSASGKTGDTGSSGVVVGYRDDKNYTVFRWAGVQSPLPFKGRAQLLRYTDGTAKIVSDTPAPPADDDGYLRVRMRFTSGAITAYVRNEVVAQAADESLRAGRVGLWVQGTAPVTFREVVMFLPPEPDPPKVAPKMEADALMVGWASPAGEWPPRKTESGLEFWNTGEFFGDAHIEYLWKPEIVGRGAVEWALRASSPKFDSGYVLRAEGADKLVLTLSHNGEVLKQGNFSLQEVTPDAPPTIRIEMEGRAVLASVSGVPVLSYLPENRASIPTGTRLAARSKKFTLSVKSLLAHSANRDDYTFNQAPTDWYSPSGNWSVFSRWPCYSDWSFFGGQGQSPVLWSKREYSGDTVVEMYVHPQMDLPKELGYSHPGDLNVTLAGDGKTAASGYSFVLAGWSNTRSAILKNSDVVAESTSAKARFDRPINHNSEFHKRWYYVRAEARKTERNGKAGVLLRFLVDEELLAEYFDANPLPAVNSGGRVAFWTVDGAMMIARAKIEAENLRALKLPAGLPDAAVFDAPAASGDNLVPRAVMQDGQHSALVESESGVWKMTNPTGGGTFAVALQRSAGEGALKVGKSSRFETDLALSADAKLDLYFSVNGVRHLVELNSGQRPDAATQKLGKAAVSLGTSAEGQQWRSVSFNLGEALAKKFPNKTQWDLEKIEIGALHGDEYRWQGFGGNPLGASYIIKDTRLIDG